MNNYNNNYRINVGILIEVKDKPHINHKIVLINQVKIVIIISILYSLRIYCKMSSKNKKI